MFIEPGMEVTFLDPGVHRSARGETILHDQENTLIVPEPSFFVSATSVIRSTTA